MPRLVGKKTNYTLWMIPILVVIAAGAVAQMEYTGTIDIVPKFGRDYDARS